MRPFPRPQWPRLSPSWSSPSIRPRFFRRELLTLAIETSCDDTSVAVLEHSRAATVLHFHEKITSDNVRFLGINPVVSANAHQENLALLVDRAVRSLPAADPGDDRTITCKNAPDENASPVVARRLPDFVSVTRGPGMYQNLKTGLDTAKGLAVAWQVPFVGVNHMQAHALTPRLVSALNATEDRTKRRSGGGRQSTRTSDGGDPCFPFVSLLVSGGHTLLIYSGSLTSHRILANTTDIAVGDNLDKIARQILPSPLLLSSKNTMFGALLERYAFPSGPRDYNYTPPPTLADELKSAPTPYGWRLTPPYSRTSEHSLRREPQFTFTGLGSAVDRIMRHPFDPATSKILPAERLPDSMPEAERRLLAREAMRVAFEHVVGRSLLGLEALEREQPGALAGVHAFVASGGVAANGFLRHVLRAMLDARGFGQWRLEFPPPALCTDNAAMVAWAGAEMFAEGVRTGLEVRPLRKWPLDQLMSETVGEDG